MDYYTKQSLTRVLPPVSIPAPCICDLMIRFLSVAPLAIRLLPLHTQVPVELPNLTSSLLLPLIFGNHLPSTKITIRVQAYNPLHVLSTQLEVPFPASFMRNSLVPSGRVYYSFLCVFTTLGTYLHCTVIHVLYYNDFPGMSPQLQCGWKDSVYFTFLRLHDEVPGAGLKQ